MAYQNMRFMVILLIDEKPSLSGQNIIKSYTRVWYIVDIMRQSACLVVNLITVYSFGALFNCTTTDQASYSKTILT